jgi:hypothetical protein
MGVADARVGAFGADPSLTSCGQGGHVVVMKKNVPATEPISLGTRLGEKTRAIANNLSDGERERLLHRGLQMIYAERREKKTTHRR